MKLKFNPKDWEELHNYLKEWDKWRKKKPVGLPDYTTDAIFTVPLTIYLMKSQKQMTILTWILIILTAVLIVLMIKTI